MKKKARCILSVFMAVLMVFSCTLATAFAGEVPPEDEDGEMKRLKIRLFWKRTKIMRMLFR